MDTAQPTIRRIKGLVWTKRCNLATEHKEKDAWRCGKRKTRYPIIIATANALEKHTNSESSLQNGRFRNKDTENYLAN